MAKESISETLARNLGEAMTRRQLTQVSLAKASGVPQTTISVILNPSQRLPTRGAEPGTTVVRVAMLAAALGLEAWQLLHPDPERAQREIDFYKRIAENFAKLER